MIEGPHLDAAPEIHEEEGAHDVYERCYKWLQNLESGSRVRLTDCKEHTLTGACCGMLLLEGLGGLQSVSPEERLRWGSYVQEFQDRDSGWFVDSSLHRVLGQRAEDNGAYGTHQMTYLALQALDALGMKASHRLRFMDDFSGAEATVTWLKRLDWSNAWLQGDRVMCVLALFIYRAEVEQARSAPVLFHSILDWLDRSQDPKTGLWGTQEGASLLNAVAAASRLIPFYEYVHRPVTRLTRIIDTVLSLQPLEGSLAGPFGGGGSEDLAAIDLLATFTRQVSYRKDEIKRVLIQSYRAIRDMQNEDGGFSYGEGEAVGSCPSGIWSAIGVEPGSRSIWASWLRLLALATIERRYPGDLPQTRRWRFRRWPALGYHRSDDHLNDHEREALPLWIRPTSYAASPAIHAGSEPPAISVIIPCYNLGRYLHEAVESVLAQTAQDFEVIIVNDGSTDEFTRLLLRNYDRPKTRVVHQANKGLPAARNFGIRQARGRYICCLDPDDRLRPAFFEKALAILESRSNVGFVTGYCEMFDKRDDVFGCSTCTFPDLLVSNPVIEPALFRRDAWGKAGGYCETFSFSGIEDWDLWITILELGYLAEIIPEIVWEYRIHPDQMSTRMYSPETWSRLCRELAARHEKTYRDHMIKVIAKHGTRWAELRQWATELEKGVAWWEGQSAKWQRLAEEREKTIQEQRGWNGELERGVTWWGEQSTNWRRLAEERGKMIQEQQAWIGRLEQGRAWLEEQMTNCQRLAEEREKAIQEQRGWNRDLGQDIAWWEGQSTEWQRLAEERERIIQERQVWIEELERAKAWLEEQMATWQRLAGEREKMIQEQRVWIGELERAKAWLEEQRSNWQRLAEERHQAARQ